MRQKCAHQLERFGLTAEQAVRQRENIREPETEIEKALCERLPAVKYRKRTTRYGHIAAVSGVVAAFAAIGILISILSGTRHTDINDSDTNESPAITVEVPAITVEVPSITTATTTDKAGTSSVPIEITMPAQQTTASAPVEEPQSEVVYITKSGKRYHKADCRHIAGHDVIEKTIAEAEEDGYTPCKDCF